MIIYLLVISCHVPLEQRDISLVSFAVEERINASEILASFFFPLYNEAGKTFNLLREIGTWTKLGNGILHKSCKEYVLYQRRKHDSILSYMILFLKGQKNKKLYYNLTVLLLFSKVKSINCNSYKYTEFLFPGFC